MSGESDAGLHDGKPMEIPAERARQGITGVRLRYVLAVSVVGAVIAVGLAYAIVI